jgi:hypothetical protein
MMAGWIKLHRKVLQSDMYRTLNAKQKVVLFTLLLMANHQPRRWEFQGQIYTLKPGQMITSLAQICALSADCEVTVQTVRTALKKLEKWGFLTNRSTKRNRLITIVNWALYQGEGETVTNDSTNSQQSAHNQPTECQQSINKEPTTNKNDKNGKNEKNHLLPQSTEAFHQIEQHYLQQSGRQRLTMRDRQSIQELLEQGISVDVMIRGIDYAFFHFQPQHEGDQIRSFAYCAKVIRAQQKGASVLETSAKDSIDDEEDLFADYIKNNYYAPLLNRTYPD